MDGEQTIWPRESFANLRALLLEALQAGMFLSREATWRPHFTGEILYFADRVFGVERPAVLVLAEELTTEIVDNAAESDFRSTALIGLTLAPGVELGQARATRAARIAETDVGEHYWATFVLDNAILVTHGTPLSWCRLVGEVMNAQISTPFVQRKICQHCHALNDYHARVCANCQTPLSLTGKLT